MGLATGCSQPPRPSAHCRELARRAFEHVLRIGTPGEAHHARQQLERLRTDPNSVHC